MLIVHACLLTYSCAQDQRTAITSNMLHMCNKTSSGIKTATVDVKFHEALCKYTITICEQNLCRLQYSNIQLNISHAISQVLIVLSHYFSFAISLANYFKAYYFCNYQKISYTFIVYRILIINPVIRLFLLRRFLKNYTTNFNEILHVLLGNTKGGYRKVS